MQMRRSGLSLALAVLAQPVVWAAEIDLMGAWQLADEKGEHACAAAVPGDVYGALLAAKLIPDPYWGRNELDVQWVRKIGWTYRRTFSVDAALLEDPSAVLRLDDVDLFCEIKVNGRTVGKTDNRFRRWEFDVKPYLKAGENVIEGVFDSTERRIGELRKGYARDYQSSFDWVENMALVRKPACHQGWDWGVTLMTTGFCGPVKIVTTPAGERRIDSVWCEQRFSDDLKYVDVTVYAETTDATGARAVVTNAVAIDSPQLWWPAGMGGHALTDIPYEVDGKRYVKRIGLRKVALVRGTAEKPTFHFEVNGVPLFAKGANWVPADALECRQTPERYRDLLESCVAANFNMVRVWGGGIYEKDCFYDLCDELGLLVWQDFMFSCAVYPADAAFLENVRREAEWQIRRLRDHASVVLWCGDNECLGANRWFSWGGRGEENQANWVAKTKVLGEAVRRLDPARTFWPSSPCWGPDDFGNGWDPGSLGDMHYWAVWGQDCDIEKYASFVPLFASEFGFQSHPSPEVAATFCEMKGADEPAFAHHQKNKGGNEKILGNVAKYLGEASGFTNLLYLSQVQQVLAIRTAVEAWRARMPQCMGALYWQLNDVWPVSSWASVEYGGKWKQLQYHAKRFFAPTMVTGLVEKGKDGADVVAVYGVNDRGTPHALVLETYAGGFDGTLRRVEARLVVLAPRTSTRLAEYPPAAFGADKAPNARYAAFRLVDGRGQAHARNETVFARFAACRLASEPVEVKVDGFEVALTSRTGAFSVWVNADGIRGEFDDNAITLLPGERRVLRFRPKGEAPTPEAFAKSISVVHLGQAVRGEGRHDESVRAGVSAAE